MKSISRVVPAILTDDPKALKTMIHQAEKFARWVQVDVMDGKFVPSISITYHHLAGIPIKFGWEAHLMVQHPEEYLEGFKQAGAQKVIFHYEATSAPQQVISRARGLGLDVGLAINPDTPVESILPLTEKVDSVLFLSVYPGFYGKEFIPRVLDKISEFRNTLPNVEVGIDGGIKEGNIAQVARTGVDTIYVGSAIFNHKNPAQSYRRLVALAEQGSRERNR